MLKSRISLSVLASMGSFFFLQCKTTDMESRSEVKQSAIINIEIKPDSLFHTQIKQEEIINGVKTEKCLTLVKY